MTLKESLVISASVLALAVAAVAAMAARLPVSDGATPTLGGGFHGDCLDAICGEGRLSPHALAGCPASLYAAAKAPAMRPDEAPVACLEP